jgi:chromosome partitioning protein
MSVPVLTFFNNKGGVGKTSLVFHLAWMMSTMGRRVLAMDLDPQANLTSAFLDEDVLERLWDPSDEGSKGGSTIFNCLRPLTKVGDILPPAPIRIKANLHLVPGDLALAGFEDSLSPEWAKAMGSSDQYRPFRLLTAFWQVGQFAAQQTGCDVILQDVGPNLGAINRSALLASDHVLIPLGADLFSIQGLRNLGPTLKRWRSEWAQRRANYNQPEFDLPLGGMTPQGYILLQHVERLSRPVKAFNRWAERIPGMYAQSVLGQELDVSSDDVHCLARLKNYRSLMPMAQEARKPIFRLTTADGALGNHIYAVRDAKTDFEKLADTILQRTGLKQA